jgi:LMBR1 domain-containing protein 1
MKSDATGQSSARYDEGRYIKRYRMMLYLHMLYDVPKDIDTTKNYSIEYTILGQKQRYKVELANAFSINGDILIPINKLRVVYFFSKDRKGVNDFINEQRVISLNLFCDGEKLGTVNFELNDFLSDKVIKREMFKVFGGKKLPILSWGLKVTVGLTEGGMEDVNRTKFHEHKNIYLSNPDFYTCDALPDEWLQVFEETHKHLNSLLNKTETRRNSRYLNTSLNNSFRKSNLRASILRTSVLKPQALGRDSGSKIESPDEILMNPSDNSPNKSLFENDKSISEELTEKSRDDSLEVVRKILAESIKDYEKGDKRLLKKPLKKINPKDNNSGVHKNQQVGGSKSAATPARSWSAAIRPGSKQKSENS